MIARTPEMYDGRASSEEQRLGVCHISDVLPIVLARISATTPIGMDRRLWPQDEASNVMPAPGVVAD